MTDCDGMHTRVFAYSMAPDAETPVRKRLSQRLDGFRCDLQAMYTPNYASGTGTRITVRFPPPVMSANANANDVEGGAV